MIDHRACIDAVQLFDAPSQMLSRQTRLMHTIGWLDSLFLLIQGACKSFPGSHLSKFLNCGESARSLKGKRELMRILKVLSAELCNFDLKLINFSVFSQL